MPRVRARVGTQAMKTVLVFVLALSAIAYGQRLPFPEALKEKFPDWAEEDPDHLQRVVGGTKVTDGGRPFQILLEKDGRFTCGGSLIANNKVLTAAHCVYGQESNPTAYTVRYNTLTSTGGQVIGVSAIARHESYSSSTIDYDVAVLTLSSAFTPGTNAQLVELATSEPGSGVEAVVSGFGKVSGSGDVSPDLLQASLNIVDRPTCQQRFSIINTITERMTCANASGKGACNGDSGGPLTVGGKQVGVVSWGMSGCSTSFPTVFGNVVNLRDWVLKQ